MKCVELNPEGNFDPWDPEKIEELNKKDISKSLGQDLLFENDEIRLWDITLWPNERLPFRIQNSAYSWTCLTNGLAISRHYTGKISLLRFAKGDTAYAELSEPDAVRDLENIGEGILKISVVEYKWLDKSKKMAG